jgi:very-short-patch-repair endonuclease
MGYNKAYGCTYPTTAKEAAHMKLRQEQNKNQNNEAENWMYDVLKKSTPLKWTRQAIWGCRIFDFWCHEKGLAVEVDGNRHNHEYDSRHDKYHLKISGIKVLRLKPFDETRAMQVVDEILSEGSWNERRGALGLKLIKT